MCSRFTLTQEEAEIIERFLAQQMLLRLETRYNIAPSQRIATVAQEHGVRTLVGAKWGLVPSWAKDPKAGSKMINARAEGLAEKPSFKSALKNRRCIIPADGFYEWRKTPTGKQPMWIHLKSNGIFGFAGLYDNWKQPDGDSLRTCTIITTSANELMQPIHDRMPVILQPEHEADWLEPTDDAGDIDYLLHLLKPYPSGHMVAEAVSTAVNKAGNDVAECIAPVGETQNQQQSLFFE